MELSSWDYCQFKCYNAWKALTVTGKVGASVNAQPATATKLLLLPQLLFQDTSAPAHRDSLPLSPHERHSNPSQDNPNYSQGHVHQPSSTKGSLPIQSFHERDTAGK